MSGYAFIGDVHACYDELTEMLNNIPEDKTIVFLGDAFDRGPAGLKVLELIYDMVITKGIAKYVRGNHCNKIYRWLTGNPVKLVGGIKTFAAELDKELPFDQKKYKLMFIKLYENSDNYLLLEDGQLVAVHAGWKDDIVYSSNQKEIESVCIYNKVYTEKGPDGFPIEWIDKYQGNKTIVRGHIVYNEQPNRTNNVYSIDTGCVHGGNLTTMLWPEKDFIQVEAKKNYGEG